VEKRLLATVAQRQIPARSALGQSFVESISQAINPKSKLGGQDNNGTENGSAVDV